MRNNLVAAIWRLSIYWCLLLTGLAFGLCGLWGLLIFSRRSRKHLRYAIWLPIGFTFLGCLATFISGTVIGASPLLRNASSLNQLRTGPSFFCSYLQPLLLVSTRMRPESTSPPQAMTNARSSVDTAAVYNSVYIRMSTWVPFLWSAAQTLGRYCGRFCHERPAL